MSKRINLFAGPGAGKSTTAAWLFAEMKMAGHSVELVTEYVKAWACEKREIKAFDQVYLLGKQMQYEYRFLAAGIKNIITDSPVLLSCSYAKAYRPQLGIHGPMLQLVRAYEKEYPSINIFLNRDDKPYVQEGRYQDTETAKKLDLIIREDLNEVGIEFVEYSFYDKKGILEYVIEQSSLSGY